jgi:hypothetical protein
MLYGSMQNLKYKAAGNTTPIIRSIDGNILTIDGIVLDTVKTISSIQKMDFEREVRNLQLFDWIEEMEAQVKSSCPEGEDVLNLYLDGKHTWEEAYWRTIIANRAGDGPAPATYGEYFELLKSDDEGRDSLVQAINLQRRSTFINTVHIATKNRRFITTRKATWV